MEETGTYYIKEKAPSPGLYLDTTVYSVDVKYEKVTTVTSKEPPVYADYDVDSEKRVQTIEE